MKAKSILSAVFFIQLHVCVLAENKVFTVESAVTVALTNNTQMAAARLTILEAKGRLQQAGRWSNPELESEFAPNVRGREGYFRIGFNQRFPITSRLRTERNISRAELRVAEAEIRNAERKFALEVRTTAIGLAAFDAQLTLKRTQFTNNQELVRTFEQVARLGEGPVLQAAQQELEGGKLVSQILQLKRERTELEVQLGLLLGLPLETGLRIDDPLEILGSKEANSVSPKRAEVEAAESKIEAAREAVKFARAGRWEDLTLGIFSEVNRHDDAPRGIETEKMVGIRFSIPLPLWNRNRGRIVESETKMLRMEYESQALLRKIEAEVLMYQKQMEAAAEAAGTLSQTFLPKSREVEQALIQLHKEGRVNFTEVLRARERRLELESQELDSRRDYHLARANYLTALGRTK